MLTVIPYPNEYHKLPLMSSMESLILYFYDNIYITIYIPVLLCWMKQQNDIHKIYEDSQNFAVSKGKKECD